jgi:hypothetical protein
MVVLDPQRWLRDTPLICKSWLAPTSPTSGGLSVGIVRSRTQAMEFVYCDNIIHCLPLLHSYIHVVLCLQQTTRISDDRKIYIYIYIYIYTLTSKKLAFPAKSLGNETIASHYFHLLPFLGRWKCTKYIRRNLQTVLDRLRVLIDFAMAACCCLIKAAKG